MVTAALFLVVAFDSEDLRRLAAVGVVTEEVGCFHYSSMDSRRTLERFGLVIQAGQVCAKGDSTFRNSSLL